MLSMMGLPKLARPIDSATNPATRATLNSVPTSSLSKGSCIQGQDLQQGGPPSQHSMPGHGSPDAALQLHVHSRPMQLLAWPSMSLIIFS